MAETLQITSQGQGLPLVFIHGWGLNSGIWQPLANKLAINFQVITVDLPGYGLNIEHNITPYSLENICQQLAQVITQPAVYIGWSLGGLVASQMSLSFPERVLGLVNVTSSPCFLEKKSNEDNWPGIKANLLAAFHHQLADDTKKTIEGFLKIQAMGSPHIRKDLKQIRALIFQYSMPKRQVLDHSLALLETVDLRAQLAKITVPFLRLYGRLDSLIPKNVSNLVDALAPNSESYVFQQASHAPFISHEDEFYQVLKQWLQTNRF